jgi:hypothetical protein
MKWTKVTKTLPEEGITVVALTGHSPMMAHVKDGEWFMTSTIRLGGVTKWMAFPEEPKDFDYWKNKVVTWWIRRKVQVQTASDWATGWGSKNAQINKKVVFYRDNNTGEVMTGGPERFSAPAGYEKIVCNNVMEAERWSGAQRNWEYGRHSELMEKREREEGPIRDQIRSEIQHKMANARNETNREFLRRHLEQYDKKPDPWKYKRESHLHAEGYENGR